MELDALATEQDLVEFRNSEKKKLDKKLRGVLMEIATAGVLRYSWDLLLPLISTQMEYVLRDYHAEEQVEIGPDRPLPQNETLDSFIARLLGVLRSMKQAPFTIQRLTELLLEPKKQYVRLDKIAFALEKLSSVSMTIPVMSSPPPLPTSMQQFPAVNQKLPPVCYDQVNSSEVFDGYVEQRISSTNGVLNGQQSSHERKPESSTNVDLTSSLFSVSQQNEEATRTDGSSSSSSSIEEKSEE